MLSKNLLQEYYQKKKEPLPVYEIIRLGGFDHLPRWQCRVTTSDKIVAIGGVKKNKSEASMSAAKKVLKIINNKPIVMKSVPDRTVLLVDVENLPKFVDSVVKIYNNLDIYAFVGKKHCLAHKEVPNGVHKILSPSTRQDGTDTCMQVYVGYLLANNKYDNYLIATMDHYGDVLVEMINHHKLIWEGKEARVVVRPEDIG